MSLMRKQGKNGTYLDLYPNSEYDPTEYERACNTVDIGICRIRNNQLQILLIKRKEYPFENMWAIPGGFVDVRKNESFIDAAYRELEEETGVLNIPVRPLQTFDEPFRDPRWRIISNMYFALVSETVIDKTKIEANDDASEYGWFDVSDLPQLAFDHNHIIATLVNKIKELVIYKPIAFEFIPSNFTWYELQSVYEVLLDRNLSRTNFRRDIKRLYNVEETSLKELGKTNKRGTKAKLFTFISEINRFQ